MLELIKMKHGDQFKMLEVSFMENSLKKVRLTELPPLFFTPLDKHI